MKRTILLLVGWLALPLLSAAASGGPNLLSSHEPLFKPARGHDFSIAAFGDSWLFTPKSWYVWADFQTISTRGKRKDFTKHIIPPIGLNLERQIWKGFGLRVSLSTNWWEEEKTLAYDPTEDKVYKEPFQYQFWALGAGLAWHLTLDDLDPYFGYMYSFRQARAECECFDETNKFGSHDFWAGARYFLSNRLYLSGELGQHGTGYLKFGLGFKIH